MGKERQITTAFLAASGALLLLIFITGGFGQFTAVVVIVASFSATASLVTFKYGYWIVPFITKKVRVIEVIDEPPEIAPGQDALIKKIGGKYYASQFLLVKIYESVTEKSEEDKEVFMDLWERAASGLKFVTKFTVSSIIKDLTKYKESIDARKAAAQLNLASERDKPTPDQILIEKYEREITMWDNMVSKLSIGDKPISNFAYIMTTGSGSTPEMALVVAKAQANDIRSTISTTLGVEVTLLTGDDMKKCFDWEYIIPPVFKEEVG
jgi:hypothetical protein